MYALDDVNDPLFRSLTEMAETIERCFSPSEGVPVPARRVARLQRLLGQVEGLRIQMAMCLDREKLTVAEIEHLAPATSLACKSVPEQTLRTLLLDDASRVATHLSHWTCFIDDDIQRAWEIVFDALRLAGLGHHHRDSRHPVS